MLALGLLVVQGYCEEDSAQDLFLTRRPHAPHILRAVDAVPLLLVHLVLRLVAAIAHAEQQQQTGRLLAPEFIHSCSLLPSNCLLPTTRYYRCNNSVTLVTYTMEMVKLNLWMIHRTYVSQM